MAKAKNKTQDNIDKKQSFRVYHGIILGLLATMGLLNRFIGSFLTWIIYALFGHAYIIFFIYMFLLAIVIVLSQTREIPRVKRTTTALILILLGITMLFFHKEYPRPNFSDIGTSVKEIGPFKDAMGSSRPNFTNAPKGGLIGGFLYTVFFLFLEEVGAIIVACLVILIGFVIVIWPLIKKLHVLIKESNDTKKKKKKIIMHASETPTNVGQEVYAPKPLQETKQPFESSGLEIAIPTVKPENEYQGLRPLEFVGSSTTQGGLPLEITPQTLASEEEIVPEETISNVNDKDLRFNVNFSFLEKEVEETIPTSNLNGSLQSSSNIYPEQETVAPQPSNEPLPTPFETIKVEPEIQEEFVEEEVEEVKPKRAKKVIKKKDKYIYPSLDLLTPVDDEDDDKTNIIAADEALNILNQEFMNLNIGAQAISYTIGPSITRFDIKMNADESVNTINKYIPDLNIRLGGIHGRFEQVVVGKATSGFEIPNEVKKMVRIRSCIEKLPKISPKTKMVVPFGMNISGEIINGRLDEFPHLLVAGATGSGKTVYVHSMIVTLIMRNSPEELRFLIIDPKRVEMARYAGMPHLLCPIVKEPAEAKVALFKLLDVMEERYKMFEETGASKLAEYNEIAEEEGLEKMARIVVIVDEYADLVESEPEVATPIVRLAQKSRACGIHLVICTQRPSVDVITGVIKANLPTRVALMVSSAVDSKTILGQGGAEMLLGNGDMLVDCSQISRSGFTRIQGAYVSTAEVRAVVNFLKDNNETVYDENFLDLAEKVAAGPLGLRSDQDVDPIYEQVKSWVLTQERVSKNRLSNTFKLGFNRAAAIYETLLADGIIIETDEANSSRGALVVAEEEKLSPSEEKIENYFKEED